jgi:hypothetical protein
MNDECQRKTVEARRSRDPNVCGETCEPMHARMGFYGICQLQAGHDGAHDSSVRP